MEFKKSPRSTVGIEWELQLIDVDSYDLRQAGAAVMDAVEALPEDTSMIHREMLLNTVEIVSQPRRRVADACADLEHSLEILEKVIGPLRITLASSGTHPFANPIYQRVTDSERYAELVKRTQYWGRQMLIYGTHVHAGIDDPEKALPILSALLTRFAHIQALAAASPFWSGSLTGYADNRAMVFQQLPTAGTPLQFSRWEEIEEYEAGMKKTGIIENFDEIRWDIRPSPKFGTLELRMCDAATNVREIGMIAALCQCLVEYFSQQLDAGKPLPKIPDWFVSENKWRASRYGMEAILILDDAGNEEPVTDTLRRMVTTLAPIAAELGCEEELNAVSEVLEVGAPYQRMLSISAQTHRYREAIVRFMIAEMEAGHPLDPHDFVASERSALELVEPQKYETPNSGTPRPATPAD
ncbi:glutamate--cysteine ligase [Actinobaculum suis]|uniref:glutamate--cysteine ligase n=1 Tax=Actinobaculum suis TaxID=1657 RepID=UPI0008086CE6|nr:glutamate--cysteine ligase [Actinobaculum suis]OCA93721.1 carboxylate--amine ligase [Actinobaculum suis]OCA94014.1 carboxylate--amine ligase [Actinobaculum suis]